jgi:hypothetical protein
MLDGVATRYHLLPSEVMARADTLDLLVMDVAQGWHNYQQKKVQARASGEPESVPDIPLNTLQQMIERVRK